MEPVKRSHSFSVFSVIAAFLATAVVSAPRALAGSFIGDMLVADYAQSQVVAFDPSTGAYEGVFANLGTGYAQTLAEGPNGTIYVTSPSAGNVLAFNGASGQLISSFQFSPPTPGNYASGITFDSSGNLYVIDQAHGAINEYNPTTGAFIRTVVSGLGAGGGVGVAFASGYLYVTNSSGIQQFSLTGQLGLTFGGRQYYQITTGPDGNLYAADGGSSVYEFAPSGSQVGSGPFVTGVGGAYGGGFGPDGSIYVANNGNDVFKFDSNGSPIGSSPFFQYAQSGNPGLCDVLYDAAPVSVPEPGTLTLLSIAACAVACRASRKSVRRFDLISSRTG
jgi:outer membrane protein assembly factor BamB